MVAPEEEVDKFKIVSYSEIKDNDDYPKLTKCNITLEEFEDDIDATKEYLYDNSYIDGTDHSSI